MDQKRLKMKLIRDFVRYAKNTGVTISFATEVENARRQLQKERGTVKQTEAASGTLTVKPDKSSEPELPPSNVVPNTTSLKVS